MSRHERLGQVGPFTIKRTRKGKFFCRKAGRHVRSLKALRRQLQNIPRPTQCGRRLPSLTRREMGTDFHPVVFTQREWHALNTAEPLQRHGILRDHEPTENAFADEPVRPCQYTARQLRGLAQAKGA